MLKRFVFGSLLVLFLGLISGCNTAKGTAEGVGSVAKGIGEDMQGLGAGVMSLDAWIKKNMW